MTDQWRVWRQSGYSGLSKTMFWAISPGCPMHGHAIRHCACHVFRTPRDAEAYAVEQNQSIAVED